MKRIVLLCELPKGNSVESRTLALPADWLLRRLHPALAAAFPDLASHSVVAYSDPKNHRGCGGGHYPDPHLDWKDGMTLAIRLSDAFADEGNQVACRSCELHGDGEAELALTVLRPDEGRGPECLHAEGPESGTGKPDPDAINRALRRMARDPDAPDELDEYDDSLLDFFSELDDSFRTELKWRSPALAPKPHPEPLALDDTPADPALHRRACELARRVWDLAPWKTLPEGKPVVLRLPDGRERVLSVMGELGEYRALAFYPDAAVFQVFESIARDRAPFGPNHFFTFWHWQLAFLKTADLLPAEAAAVKASGVKFARGALPSFETFAPGFMPKAAGGRELADLVPLLEDAVALFSDSRAMSTVATALHQPGFVHVWKRNARGVLQLSQAHRSDDLRFPFALPPKLLDRIRALPLSNAVVSFGELVLPAGEKNGRTVVRRLLLAADETRALPFPPDLGESAESARLFQPADLLANLANALLRPPFGFFPSRLASPCDFMALFLRRLAELRGPDARFDPDAECPVLEEWHARISSSLGL